MSQPWNLVEILQNLWKFVWFLFKFKVQLFWRHSLLQLLPWQSLLYVCANERILIVSLFLKTPLKRLNWGWLSREHHHFFRYWFVGAKVIHSNVHMGLAPRCLMLFNIVIFFAALRNLRLSTSFLGALRSLLRQNYCFSYASRLFTLHRVCSFFPEFWRSRNFFLLHTTRPESRATFNRLA